MKTTKTLFFALLILQFSCTSTPNPERELKCSIHVEMGTPFKLCVVLDQQSEIEIQSDFTEAFKLLREIDSWMSDWREGTMLTKINALAGQSPSPVSQELFDLLQMSLQISKDSDGAFDPTFNVFWGLYNFKKGQEREPTQKEINERLPLLNYKLVTMDSKNLTVKLNKKGMKLGLGGIGQGYAVDQIVKHLKFKGYRAGYVDGSGDTYFWGKKPDGTLWSTGVRNPITPGEVVGKFYGTDYAVTTCGDDEKFFIKNGKRIHHIINPKTGRPADLVRQVTVVAPTTVEADGLDTAAFVLGPVKGIELLEKRKVAGVFVLPDGTLKTTSNIRIEDTPWGQNFVLIPN